MASPSTRHPTDCVGCRFVWGQVEMDIGAARYVEDVQASFEHNCMDAQKSTVFYGVVCITSQQAIASFELSAEL